MDGVGTELLSSLAHKRKEQNLPGLTFCVTLCRPLFTTDMLMFRVSVLKHERE